MKKTPHSYSRVKNALTCPAAYRYYLERQPTGVEAVILQEGSLFHAFAERYAKHCMDENQQTDIGTARHIARTAFEDMRAEYVARREHFLGELDFERVVDTLVMPFAESHLFDVANIAEVESLTAVDRSLAIVEWDSPEAWFRARLDLVVFPEPRTGKVIDYKAGFSPEADELQMEFYAWLMLSIYAHLDAVECELDFVRFNVQKSVTFTREQLPWLDEKLRGILDRVDAIEEFAAAPGIHCLHCHYRGVCDAKASLPQGVTTIHEARQTVEAISLLQRDLEDAKANLRAWCVEHGPVEHNSTVWGIHAQGGMGYDDAKAFADAATELGINPFPYLSVNGTKVKTKKAQKKLAPLAHLQVNKRSTVFTGKKAGKEDE